MEVGDVWCRDCNCYHADGRCPLGRPDTVTAAALDDLLSAVREQEVNWDLDNRIRLSLSQDEARRARRP